MPSHRGISELGLVSAPDQHPPRLVALAIAVERHRKAAIQELDGGPELILRIDLGQGSFDEVSRNAAPREIPRNPFAPPLVDQPPVLGEATGVAGVVDETLLAEGTDDIADDVALIAPPAEEGLDFALRPLPDADRLQRPLECTLTRIAQAAFASSSSMTTPSSSTAGGSGTAIGPPVLGTMPMVS